MHKFNLLFSLLLFVYACKTTESSNVVKAISLQGITTEDSKNNPIKGLNEPHTTVFFIVRHAEKAKDQGDDPNLTSVGEERSKRLAALLKDLKIERVGHTEYKRSVQTAQPIIQSKSCGYDVYSNTVIEPYLLNTIDACKGKSVLVVAHSNTIPLMLNALSGSTSYVDVADEDYSNLYVVSVVEKGNATVAHYRF